VADYGEAVELMWLTPADALSAERPYRGRLPRERVMLAMNAGYSADAAVRLLPTYVILGEQMPNTPKEA